MEVGCGRNLLQDRLKSRSQLPSAWGRSAAQPYSLAAYLYRTNFYGQWLIFGFTVVTLLDHYYSLLIISQDLLQRLPIQEDLNGREEKEWCIW